MFYSVVHPTNRKQVSLEASGGSENMCLKLATKCLLSHKKVESNFGNHWTSENCDTSQVGRNQMSLCDAVMIKC
jgi:hypothetical protein